jgi:CRP/FNR family transcriptional regulator, cyclic AMP receptor protein
MNPNEKQTSDMRAVLTRVDARASELKCHKDQGLYSQGDPADCVFFLQTGRVKVAVVSREGKEAVVGILQPGDFCGEECLAGHRLRIASVTALTECALVRLEKAGVVRALHEDPAFSQVFTSFLMARSIRMQDDLVDQLLNSTEKRLARLLLILANYGKEEPTEGIVPKISQETLAEMIGTSRTHVNFFMNKFRQLGLIDYNGDIKVHRTLLNMLLHDRPAIESRDNG